jgi:cytochrome c oxidase subunit 3
MAQHAAHGDRLAINRLGLWLFIASESCLFAALIAARYYVLGLHVPDELNQALGLGLTGLLLLSSLTAYRAEAAAAHGEGSAMLRNLLFTILLGVGFFGGVAYEWSQASHHFPPGTAFGTAFFSLTGLHAFHVLTGVLILAVVYLMGRRGAFTSGSHWGVEAGVKYWHFVDVAWVAIYPTLYLVS